MLKLLRTRAPGAMAATQSSPRSPPTPRMSPRLWPRQTTCSAAPEPEKKWAGRLPHSSGVAVLSAAGLANFRPKTNQDTFIVERVQERGLMATLVGVFDGHGSEGHIASAWVSHQVTSVVHRAASQALSASAHPNESSLSQWGDAEPPSPRAAGGRNLAAATSLAAEAAPVEFDLAAAQACLERTFSLAAASMQEAECDLVRNGCTAVLCMVLPDSVVAAWAGDSRAVVGTAGSDGTYTATQLTVDHKPNKLSELTRILAAGGRVMRTGVDRNGQPAGPFRVTLPGSGPSPALSVSRGFGDLQLAHVGVVPTPELAIFPRSSLASGSASGSCSSADQEEAASSSSGGSSCGGGRPAELLIVATDGLWEVVDNDEAVAIAAAAGSPEAATEALVATARQRWAGRYGMRHADDTTVAVAFL